MSKKKNKYPNCKECKVGFVELAEENWELIGIVEKYGLQVFSNGMGGINTEAIKNILENEGYTGQEYQNLFHSMVIYLTTLIQTSHKTK